MGVVESHETVSLGPSGRELEAGEEEALLEELGGVGDGVPLVSASSHEEYVPPAMEMERTTRAAVSDSGGAFTVQLQLNLG